MNAIDVVRDDERITIQHPRLEEFIAWLDEEFNLQEYSTESGVDIVLSDSGDYFHFTDGTKCPENTIVGVVLEYWSANSHIILMDDITYIFSEQEVH